MGIAKYAPWTTGVNLVTGGNESCYVGADKVEVIQGNKREWTFGITFECISGTKTFVINGMLTEVFAAVKTEFIAQFENKVNIGGLTQITFGTKNERTVAIHVEMDVGPKYHVGIAGQNRVISADKFEALSEQQVIDQWRKRMGVNFQFAETVFENYDKVVDQIKTDQTQASEIRSNMFAKCLWAYKDCSVICSTFKIDSPGAVKFDPVGSLKVKSGKKLLLKGSSVKLDGGGATFEADGGLKAKGQALTY